MKKITIKPLKEEEGITINQLKSDLRKIVKAQRTRIVNSYQRGAYNAFEMILSLLENREPIYLQEKKPGKGA